MVRSTLFTAGAAAAPLSETIRLEASVNEIVSALETGPAAAGVNRTMTSMDFPAATVNCPVGERMLKTPEPLVIERTTMSVDPVLAMVNFESLDCPVVRLPKSSERGVTDIAGAGGGPPTPLPATPIITGPRVGSLLTSDSVPDTGPATFGVNRTHTSAERPAAIATGSVGATTLNRELPPEIEVTVSGPLPLLVIVNIASLVWPKFTLPKSIDDALTLMLGTGLLKPVPTSGIFMLARLGSVLESTRVPNCGPLKVVAKRKVTARCPPAGITRVAPPVTMPNGPLATSPLAVSGPVPVLLSSSVTSPTWPTVTFGKLSEVWSIASFGACITLIGPTTAAVVSSPLLASTRINTCGLPESLVASTWYCVSVRSIVSGIHELPLSGEYSTAYTSPSSPAH